MTRRTKAASGFAATTVGVVLAAGDGGRMRPLTLRTAKPLVPIGSRPLIAYTLEAFVANGIRDIILVVGYRAEEMVRTLGDGSRLGARLTYVTSAHTGRSNGLSLYAAREAVGGRRFVLAMADHMVSPLLMRRLLKSRPRADTLCVDRRPPAYVALEDATRVWADPAGRVLAIGKRITRWNAIDTGVFWLTEAIFHAVEAVRAAGEQRPRVIDSARWLIEHGSGLMAYDVTGASWIDVDTPADLRQAELALARRRTSNSLQ